MNPVKTLAPSREGPATGHRPSQFVAWRIAVRPRTLPISFVPVLVGTSLAWLETHALNTPVLVVALLCSALIQIGTNLQNDVGDFRRGADRHGRLGPPRATTLGWLSPRQVQTAATMSFGLAICSGVYLVWVGGLPILFIGLASVVAGAAYTSGPLPIAYTPLGELFVLVFFGVIAVSGSYYLQVSGVNGNALVAGALVGMLAAAVLVVNNTRDIDSDSRAGKRTLAVRLGPRFARIEYAALVLAPFAAVPLIGGAYAWLPLLLLPRAAGLAIRFWRETPGSGMNTLLADTVQLEVGFGALFCLAAVL
jgi:1,4-dihydroxy-2-naphthoate octaprenyltransferase